ncbi:MAG: hypothetical protein P0Y56_09820 [Candidatus Andeanibacterium colombiense]|uniref:Uncharacterized protein n=1 Tax=Candidatus Andeanibacterium colombiense TaxID=3121345 RepID=A0AAJ5X4D4_9SPHN|nr:MAG: hypothetical protein P0Y56_09820 [Sphingomonadaceae bacterium]
MKSSKLSNAIAGLAAFGLVSATSISAATPMRSADALPVASPGVGSVPYTSGAQNAWHCAQVSDEALRLNKKSVQVDEAGRVVLNGKGSPYTCKGGAGSYQAGPFPWTFVFLLVGGTGTFFAVRAIVRNDSTG